MLNICQANHLGHFITGDDVDIGRQCRKLYAKKKYIYIYAKGITLVRKFHMYPTEVKITLFRARGGYFIKFSLPGFSM